MIGGYSGVGKSTTINYIQNELNIPCFSTSVLNHQITNRIIDHILLKGTFGSVHHYWGNLNDRETKRQLCIAVAEEVIVATFGRKIYSKTVADQILASDAPICVMETIGGEEAELFESYMPDDIRIIKWNILSSRANIGVDIRKLLENPVVNIENNGTIDELKRRVWEEIDTILVLNDFNWFEK